MSDIAVPHDCPACKGTGKVVTYCREFPKRPGTQWLFKHDRGRSWCGNCGKDYNSHGAPGNHLLCKADAFYCVRELGHDGPHMDWHLKAFTEVDPEYHQKE